jgi:anti-sigma-K factor RskA
MDRETLLDLIPAYALGALDPEERAEFEAWIATDPEARRLLAEYQTVADSLVLMAAARPAPAHLQADLRRRLAESRAQPSAVAPRRPAARPTSRAWFWRPLAAVAVLVLLAAAVLFWTATRVSAPNDAAAQLFAEIAQEQNARRIALTPGEGQTQLAGEFVSDGRRAVIEVWRLPQLQANQTFEVWLIDEDGPQSGGLVEAAPPGEPTYIVLPLEKPLDEYQGFGVSIEPEGGSPEQGPSGPRVFGVSL